MTHASTKPQQVHFQDLGRIDYQQAWDYQRELQQQLIARKRANRERLKQGLAPEPQEHHLLFCEHPPVYTLGKSGSVDHLLLDEAALAAAGFSFYKINRGGDITYHGPGQIVGYPIFDLDCFFTDVHRYVRYLEEAVILTLAEYELEAKREPGYTGVWLPATDQLPERKICAIGVHLSRWVTLHGFAFNINTNLAHFRHIVPCGIKDANKDVTSMAQELGAAVDIEAVKAKLKAHFAELFGYHYA
ncbi:MAG: lipoyl(octanoyl) transferase LipB [Bacteroidetes bacterium]|nr:MAG: lipoyl(octanoyl) transferase LipB [Bacteroidota bacterium]